MKTIGVCIIATNNYIQFFEQLYKSIEKNFLTNYRKKYYLFTNIKSSKLPKNVKIIPIKHEGWPAVTLKRYHYMYKVIGNLIKNDYILYIDADSRVIDKIGSEFLPTPEKPLIAIRHPGFYLYNKNGTPETRSTSTACISDIENHTYVCGGLCFGISHEFVRMIMKLKININIDQLNGIVAIWHDESHFNKYVFDNKHKFQLFSPDYMFPEPISQWQERLPKCTPKILALLKDHDKLRN